MDTCSHWGDVRANALLPRLTSPPSSHLTSPPPLLCWQNCPSLLHLDPCQSRDPLPFWDVLRRLVHVKATVACLDTTISLLSCPQASFAQTTHAQAGRALTRRPPHMYIYLIYEYYFSIYTPVSPQS